VDLIDEVVRLARSLGFDVDEARPLRSTNNIVVWLHPAGLVAKIHADHPAAGRELTVATALAGVGAPVVAPALGIGDRLHAVGDRLVSFWPYASQDLITEPDPTSIADTLAFLHAAFDLIDVDLASLPRCGDYLAAAVRTLDRSGFAPELARHDRRLLRRVLIEGIDALANLAAVDADHVLHGSPHGFNMLVVEGRPCFIDFETVQRGPLAWDLAHLAPVVANRYPRPIDPELLVLCRLLVSATTATWCFDGLDRGPDMRHHAEHHLGHVRSTGRQRPVTS
jgi:hypothetical protein